MENIYIISKKYNTQQENYHFKTQKQKNNNDHGKLIFPYDLMLNFINDFLLTGWILKDISIYDSLENENYEEVNDVISKNINSSSNFLNLKNIFDELNEKEDFFIKEIFLVNVSNKKRIYIYNTGEIDTTLDEDEFFCVYEQIVKPVLNQYYRIKQ